jgi:hypothetical protein
MHNPDAALQLIVKADKKYPAPYGYSFDQAKFGVGVMQRDGLVSNGNDGVFGSLDATRLAKVLADLTPVYAAQHRQIPATLNANALFTNQFLDKHLSLGGTR